MNELRDVAQSRNQLTDELTLTKIKNAILCVLKEVDNDILFVPLVRLTVV